MTTGAERMRSLEGRENDMRRVQWGLMVGLLGLLAGCVSVKYPVGQGQFVETSRPWLMKQDVTLDVRSVSAGGVTTATVHLETHADPDPTVQVLREAARLAGKGAAAGAM